LRNLFFVKKIVPTNQDYNKPIRYRLNNKGFLSEESGTKISYFY
jgi:hypothetical protein